MFTEFRRVPVFCVTKCAVWFLYLVLKAFSVSPIYVSEVLLSLRLTVA